MNTSLLPASDKRRSILNYVRENFGPRWVNLLLICLKNVINSLLFMVPPFLSKYVLDRVLPQQDWNLLVIVTLCMVVAPITGSMMILLENVWGRFIIRLSGRGRADLYNGIQHQPIEGLRNTRKGDLLTRILDDTRLMTGMVNGHLGFMLLHVVTIIVGSTILLALKPGLGAIVLMLWAGQAFLVTILGKQLKKQAAETARHNSRLSETVRELVSGAAFIKATGQEAQALGNVKDCLHQEWAHTRRGILADHRIRMLHAALNAIVLVLMYAAGGWFVLQQQMSVGSLIAFIAVYNWLRPFGASLIEMVLDVLKALPAVERVADISFPLKQRNVGVLPEGDLITLEAKHLSFRYEGRDALDDVSFRVPQGTILSIVGNRGSGKSTLADLLLGLHKPASGSISLNGISLQQIDSAWIRRHMLCVTQEVMLRSGTILDNIVYGSEGRDMETVWDAVRHAELEDWITRLPEGLLTRVGEQALQISGGERQRISIARALLRKPSILILDEATSSLDQGTERRLLDRLIQKLKGTTLIFITHRLDIALRSDEILVMNDGRLAERGTHDELLSRPGIYQELWSEQGKTAK